MEHAPQLPFFNRGPSLYARLALFFVLSLALLFVDARYQYLDSVRNVVSILMYPVERLAALPVTVYRGVGDYLTTQGSLRAENDLLRKQRALDAAALQQLQVLQAENQQLRKFLELQPKVGYSTKATEIVYVERDIFRRKVFVDKGAQAGVQPGQPVVDDRGVVGQVSRVHPWLSEVTLVTDKDNMVPVQVQRSGVRTVVYGTGDSGELSVRYMPFSGDIQPGDVLVTSGIDGTYPAGIPVAKVNVVDRNPALPFARISCQPLGGADRHRQLLIVSSNQTLPERPEPEEKAGKPKKKRGRL